MNNTEVVLFWFKRDLRLTDNRGLYKALSSGFRVLPVFIFDTHILDKLEKDDARITFICEVLGSINRSLRQNGSSLITFHGTPEHFFSEMPIPFPVNAVYANTDYEPYAVERDTKIGNILRSKGIHLHLIPDQMIMEPGTVMKQDGKPYTVFTPFSRRWSSLFRAGMIKEEPSVNLFGNLLQYSPLSADPKPETLGFMTSGLKVKPADLSHDTIKSYGDNRDIPAAYGTTRLGPHLRFGTISIREVFRQTEGLSNIFNSELIWREFFMHILSHFPQASEKSFRPEYDNIEWINNEEHFDRWCRGMTGYPIVDAGMRELKATGYMHNRVRMVTASFLAKHLLCDWRWGEAWFGSKLLDFELSSNNGNWQWAAGTGCDAAPWFRIFNPAIQKQKFDRNEEYIRSWLPDYGTPDYPEPVVNHTEARTRALETYGRVLRKS
jgi:deoxyribodipyrimidine photo-lyase